jgi:hypothetical protein
LTFFSIDVRDGIEYQISAVNDGVINNHVFQDVAQSLVERLGEFSCKFGILHHQSINFLKTEDDRTYETDNRGYSPSIYGKR